MCDTEASMHGMFGPRSSFVAMSLGALAVSSTFALASPAQAATHADPAPAAKAGDSHHCTKPAIEIRAGDESAELALERCDGAAIPAAVEKLSLLARPENTPKPKEPFAAGSRKSEVAPGIVRLDDRIVERLQMVADHFRKEGELPHVILVPPRSRTAGSYHASGRAIDFRIEGVTGDAVASFCKTLSDSGCGFYPNGGFVHIDARDRGTGHVVWIDVSKPGEAPKYVSSWPVTGATKPEAASAEKNENAKSEPKSETADKAAKAEKTETAKCEVKSEKAESAKPAKSDVANADEPSKLPPLPAVVAVVPMDEKPEPNKPAETAKSADAPKDESAAKVTATTPSKKARRARHHQHHNDHTI
jgi:hypothetical protein